MDEEVFFLGDRDRQRILLMWEEYSRRRLIRQPETPQQDKYQPPEVYLARTPSAGIPGSDVAGTGTSGDDIPGSATCDIYRLLEENNGTAGDSCLRKMFIDKVVWNVSTEDFEGDSWILVIRDKNGQWFAVSTNGGAGGGRWRMVKPTSENLDANGLYPGYVQDWNGTGYENGDKCWIYLASGEAVIANERYEGEPLTFLNDDTGTGTSTDPIRIYGICGNTIECAPDECDEDGNVVSWARLYHRAPFTIRTGFTTDGCADGGTGTG